MSDRFEFKQWNPEDRDVVKKIVKLLAEAYGIPEFDSPEKVDEFYWRNSENPIGESIVAYAEEKETGEIAAYKPYYRTTLHHNGKTYPAFQATGTATNKKFRKMGLFTKTTEFARSLMEEKERGVFMYNTPNRISYPIYMKNGSIHIVDFHTLVRPTNNYFKLAKAFLTDRASLKSYVTRDEPQDAEMDNLEKYRDVVEKFNQKREEWKDVWYSFRSVEYYQWRLSKNPLQTYQLVAVDDNLAFLAYHQRGPLAELKIMEALFSTNDLSEQRKIISKMVKIMNKRFKPDIISISLSEVHPYYEAFKNSMFFHMPRWNPLLISPLKDCPTELHNTPWAVSTIDDDMG